MLLWWRVPRDQVIQIEGFQVEDDQQIRHLKEQKDNFSCQKVASWQMSSGLGCSTSESGQGCSGGRGQSDSVSETGRGSTCREEAEVEEQDLDFFNLLR